MGDVPVPGCQIFWKNKLSALKSEYQTLVQQYPEADAQLKQLLKVLGDIEGVASHILASVGNSAEWSAIVNAAEENGVSYGKGLHGKPLFRALYGTYTVTLQELKAVLTARTLARQTNLPKTTGQQQLKGRFPVSTEAGEARHRRNHRKFKETGSADQNVARLKTSPPRKSSPETLSPPPPQDSEHGHRRFRY
jgi:hypothetical protein